MIHCEIGTWHSYSLRVRHKSRYLEQVPQGAVKMWYSEGEVSLLIYDEQGEESPLAEVEIPIKMLKAALAVAEIDSDDPYNRRRCGIAEEDSP